MTCFYFKINNNYGFVVVLVVKLIRSFKLRKRERENIYFKIIILEIYILKIRYKYVKINANS